MSTAHQYWALTLHPDPVKIARLAPGSDVPDWARGGEPLSSVTWNAEETSIIAPADRVPPELAQAGPFHPFQIEGPLDITLTGVMSGLLAPLAEARIPVITLSTFETDWILVPADHVERAANVWRYNGHSVVMVPNTDPVGPTENEEKLT
ncbi:MAG: ACT domain-containing protein [Austwickia sp.]|nr:MAG: ACT domain-containing protein [Austwickia sp.]